jgi:uncharacterized protein (TIGR02145 family)
MNISRFTLLLFVSGCSLLFSCKKNTSIVPIITLTSNSISDGSVLNAGDSAKIEFTVKATNPLSLVEILNSAGSVVQTYSDLSTNKTYSYSFITVAGSDVYKVAVNDNVGYLTNLSFTVTTKSKIATFQYGTLTDQIGYKYKTVEIGSQTWMAENLRTKIYNDGHIIESFGSDSIWNNQTQGTQCTYSNTINLDSIKMLGRLYNWYAVSTGKLCPKGWHVPTEADWKTVTTYLAVYGYGNGGSGNNIAKSLANTTGWEISSNDGEVGFNQTTNNSSGFSAIPCGERNEYGVFENIGKNASWWSSSAYYTDFAYYHQIGTYSNGLDTNLNHKSAGYSVRCIKD